MAKFMLQCDLGMMDSLGPELFFERFGGRFWETKNKSGTVVYRWQIKGGKAVDFLKFVKDNCPLKSKQASLLLPISLDILTRQKGHLTENEIAIRLNAAIELKKLHRKGIKLDEDIFRNRLN